MSIASTVSLRPSSATHADLLVSAAFCVPAPPRSPAACLPLFRPRTPTSSLQCNAISRPRTEDYIDVIQNGLPVIKWHEIVEDDAEKDSLKKEGISDKIRELSDVVRSMLQSMGDGEISISPYDTAWVALVEDDGGGRRQPQFPSSLEWISSNQLADGSWGDAGTFSIFDRILNTLACVVALRSWNIHPHKTEKGIWFMKKNMCRLDEENLEHMPIGFEVALPSLIDIAKKLGIDIPTQTRGLQEIYGRREIKLKKSLKLGIVPCPPVAALGSSQPLVYSMRNSSDTSGFSWNDKRSRQGKETFVLTRSCLTPLIADGGGAPGALLKRLHLYNIERMDNTAFGAAISACPSLLDLEILGLHVELRQTLESVSRSCPLIERLFFESSKTGRDDSLKLPTCNDLVNNCPYLSSLALRGFKLHDPKVRVLIKGLRNLKYVDFSTSYAITGDFLRNLGGGGGGSLLEILILRDCMHLREAEVSRLLSAILTGRFKLLRHLDVSNREGLASDDDWYQRCYTPSFMSLRELLEERPNLRVLADFPAEGSFVEEPMFSSDLNIDTNSPSLASSHTSDGYVFSSSSESSYNSDQSSGEQSSGNEEYPIAIYPVHGESSDEVDDL